MTVPNMTGENSLQNSTPPSDCLRDWKVNGLYVTARSRDGALEAYKDGHGKSEKPKWAYVPSGRVLFVGRNEAIEIEARARAFTGQGMKTHRFLVEPNGEVRVWDEVAGHYTNCNIMSDRTKKRIAKLAAE